jgi:hypothetical protein
MFQLTGIIVCQARSVASGPRQSGYHVMPSGAVSEYEQKKMRDAVGHSPSCVAVFGTRPLYGLNKASQSAVEVRI